MSTGQAGQVEPVVCVVQARMGSSRLPGKVLMDLGGQPMLALLLDRLAPLRAMTGGVCEIVVATSDHERDDAVAEVATAAGVPVVRGDEQDVLSRFVAALDAFDAAHVVRITADCPLSDPGLVGDVVRLHRERDADYTSNVLPRTFPKGLDVEVVRATALRTAAAEATDPAEREHVTPFVYRRPERFRLANHQGARQLGRERWTVDTAADLDRVRDLLGVAGGPTAPWEAILAAAGVHDAPGPGELWLRPAEADDEQRLLDWRNEADAVRFAGTPEPVDADAHHRWFTNRRTSGRSRVYIAERDGAATGMLRLDVADGAATVSIAIDPAFRGQGLANEILALAQAETRADCQIGLLWALIHPDNVRSQRAFTRAGFVPAGTCDGLGAWRWDPAPSGR